MINKIKYFLLFFCLVLISCKVSKNTSIPRNLERIYDPVSSSIHPEIEVYNTSDTSSVIVEKIYSKELLYNHANSENKLMARVKIIYNLYDLNNKQRLTDSLTTTFHFEKNERVKYHIIEIPINSNIGYDYFLEIITIDQNRKNNQYSFKRIDRTDEYSNRDFMIYNKNNDEIILNPYIRKNVPFGIKHYNKELDSLQVLFFLNSTRVPQVPYEDDTIKEDLGIADTSWTCYTDSINYLNFSGEGVYYFTDKIQNEREIKDQMNGFAMYNFGKPFPVIQTPEDLIKPLTYLGLKDTISSTDTIGKYTKLAVDNFWLARANNTQRSRELLRVYYKRVLYSNIYFTSYKEGWQTDRGMIYIVYGLPDYIFKSGQEEKWIYNPSGIGPGISFTFNYFKNPVNLNHYLLDREKLKATGWDEAVKIWNNGEVFYYQK